MIPPGASPFVRVLHLGVLVALVGVILVIEDLCFVPVLTIVRQPRDRLKRIVQSKTWPHRVLSRWKAGGKFWRRRRRRGKIKGCPKEPPCRQEEAAARPGARNREESRIAWHF